MGARGPGPNMYKLPETMGKRKLDVTLKREPAFTIRRLLPAKTDPDHGPGLYNVSAVTRFGRITVPNVSMGTFDHLKLRTNNTPPPNCYRVDKGNVGSGQFATLGRRWCPPVPVRGPPPNYYKLPPLKPTPGVTKMTSRRMPREKMTLPPNYYKLPPQDKYLRSAPRVSIRMRPKESKHLSLLPPPNYYHPKFVNTKIPIKLKDRIFDARVICFTPEDLNN